MRAENPARRIRGTLMRISRRSWRSSEHDSSLTWNTEQLHNRRALQPKLEQLWERGKRVKKERGKGSFCFEGVSKKENSPSVSTLLGGKKRTKNRRRERAEISRRYLFQERTNEREGFEKGKKWGRVRWGDCFRRSNSPCLSRSERGQQLQR